jgi:8-oxo-dGTP diphosphatase
MFCVQSSARINDLPGRHQPPAWSDSFWRLAGGRVRRRVRAWITLGRVSARVLQVGVEVSDYTATLARKRMAASVLFFDEAGRVLLVEPTYKPYWELPGGAVDVDESPYAAAAREIREELRVSRPVGRLLAVDWVPPRPDRTEGVVLVFDGGVLSADEVAGVRLPPDELRSWAWCTGEEAAARLSSLLARRLVGALEARRSGEVAYLENGSLYPG